MSKRTSNFIQLSIRAMKTIKGLEWQERTAQNKHNEHIYHTAQFELDESMSKSWHLLGVVVNVLIMLKYVNYTDVLCCRIELISQYRICISILCLLRILLLVGSFEFSFRALCVFTLFSLNISVLIVLLC